MRKRIGIFIVAFVLALTAGLAVACSDVKATKDPSKQYTVTYYYNYEGAPTGGVYREDKVTEKTAATKPADPTRTDYTFDKWTTDVAGKTEYAFTEKVKSDVKLYAQWTKNSAAVTFSGIEITTPPTKLTYVQGEDFDKTGMVVTAKYSDNTTKVLKADEYTITGYDKTKLGEQNVTVSYNQKAARLTVTVVAPAVDHIEITSEPNDKEYIEGDELNLDGLVVTAYYENDTSEVVTDYEVKGYNSTPTQTEEQTITVTYGGKTATFTVTVKIVELVGIEVTKRPTKREYEVGDRLDLTGMEVTAKYSDESEETLKSGDYTTSGYNGSQEGTCTITVTYRGKTDTFTVTVTQVKYTVTFRTGVDGLTAPAAQTVNKNATATDPTTDAIRNRAGYTFDGWFETGSQTAYVFTTAVTKDITLTAKWTAVTYNITYVIDNDSEGNPLATAPTTNLTYTVETSIATLPRPTAIKDGYNFIGWFGKYTVGEDGAKEYADADRVTNIAKGTTGDKTFYAYIDEKATYDFAFNYNCDDESHIDVIQVQEGKKPAALATAPTRTGYTFGGWYTTPECTTAYDFDVNIEAIAEENRVAYAKWTAKTITVEFHNGDAVTTVDVAFDQAVTEPTAPTKLGHNFDGWFMLDETEWDFDKKLCEVLDKESLTLEAKWTANKYSVTFKPDNGGDDIVVENVTFGTALGDKMPAEPTKTGYDFDGWWTSGNVQWTSASTLNAEGIELTAKWDPKTFTVSFNLNGGTGAVPAQSVDFGTKVAAPETAPTKVGHTLAGWYTAATCDCEGTCTHLWNFQTNTLQTAANMTLYARWTPKDVVVKFVDSDKTTVLGTKNIKYGEKVTALDPEPTKEHYTFWHWHTLDGEIPWNFDDVVEREGEGEEAGLLTLVAHWNANQYNVTFVLGANAEFKATFTPADKYTYGTVYTLPSSENINIKTKGYRFLGWYDNAGLTGSSLTTIAVGTSGDKTYYARVEQNSTVDFIYNHGYQGVANRVDTVVQGTPKEDNYTPERAGWEFKGWYTTSDLKVLYNFDDDVMGETTVYAKWEIKTYTITFNANNGTFADNKTTVEKTFTSIEITTDLAASAYPTRTGYTFEYWYIDSDTIAYEFGSTLTESITLKAKWKINEYTVSFNSNGGSAVSDRKVNYNSTVAKPNDPTKAGHEFKGWYKEAALTNAWTFTGENADKVTANITLYAKWQINEYTVTFDVDGGVGTVDSQTVEYNTSATKPTQTITKVGYHLKANAEWKKEDGTVWNFATDKVTTDITLYANWEINTYTVTFNSNGGTDVESQTVEHGKKATKPADPTREGWEFTGWNLNGSAYNFETATVTGDITLSAVWSGKTGTYLYVSDADGENWSAMYTAVQNGAKVEWKIAGVELYEGMQFAVVTFATGGDTWLHAAATIEQYGGMDSIVKFGTVKSNPDDPDNNDYNFIVNSYNEYYNGATWTLYITGLNGSLQLATVSSGISLELDVAGNELRDPSNTGKTIVKTATANSDVKVYLRGNFTDEFSLAEAWSTKSQIIKVLHTSDSTVYTFRKVYLKKGDSFKAYFTEEGDQGWYGGIFTGLNSVVELNNDNAPNLYLGSISTGYYDIIIDVADYTLKIIAYAEPTTASIAVTTKPTKVTYWQGEPFSSEGMVVTATNTDGDTATVTSYNLSDTATNVLGKKNVTVTYDGKTATFEITVNELKVTFDSNGGSAVTAQPVLYNGKATEPTTAREGYDFGGWFNNAVSTTEPYDFNTAVTAPITLTAKWTIHQYDVKFFNDDGTTQLGETVKVPYNTAIPANKVPTATKAGHTFNGWKNGTNDYVLTDLVTTDLNLIASFTINSYQVKLVFHDKTTTTNVNYGGTVSKPSDSETDRDGYDFDGWFNNDVSTTEQYDFATLVTGPITLTAKWTAIEYTITYNVVENGTAPANGTYTIEDAVTLATPTDIPAGYTFIGWCNNAELTGTAVKTIAKGSMGNRVYYAKITQNATVNLTFNYNYGETPETATMPVVSGTAGEALDPAPTRTGYTFKGWYTTAECTTAYTFPIMEEDDTVYALWEANKHSVTFMTLGGSAVTGYDEIEYGATITAPTPPTRDGYDFGGWYKENTFATAWKFAGETDPDTMPDADLILYAKWNKNTFTVSFDTNGGTPATIAPITGVSKNSVITAPTAPTKTDSDFVGWYTAATCECGETCTHLWNFATSKVTADITLYARWTKKTFTVTFDTNGGTPATIAPITGVEYGTPITAPAKPEKVGYDFKGWLKDGAAYTFGTGVTSNFTLTAKWEAHPYTVNYYVGDGANNEANSTTYTVEMGTDGVVTLEDAIPPTGYDFGGWYTAAEGGSLVTTISLSDFADGDEINLHAVYTIKTFTVTFDLNYTGSTNPTATVEYNKAVAPADIPTPTRANYTFGGWFTDKACSTGNGWVSTTKITTNTTVYAKWTAIVLADGVYADGEFVKALSSNSTDNKQWKVENAPLTAGSKLTFWWKGAQSTTNVYVRGGVDNGEMTGTDYTNITVVTSGYFNIYYNPAASGDNGLWVVYKGAYVAPNLQDGDGVYVGDTLVKAFELHTDGANQVKATGVTITAANDTTAVDVKFKYGGSTGYITLAKVDVQDGITNAGTAPAVKLYNGTYDFYYNYGANTDGVAGRMWIQGTQTGGPVTLSGNWYIAGSFNSWGDAVGNADYKLSEQGKIIISLKKDVLFKITDGTTWKNIDSVTDATSKTYVVSDGTNDKNLKVTQDGKYEIVYNGSTIKVTRLGDYEIVVTPTVIPANAVKSVVKCGTQTMTVYLKYDGDWVTSGLGDYKLYMWGSLSDTNYFGGWSGKAMTAEMTATNTSTTVDGASMIIIWYEGSTLKQTSDMSGMKDGGTYLVSLTKGGGGKLEEITPAAE